MDLGCGEWAVVELVAGGLSAAITLTFEENRKTLNYGHGVG